ncbi:MULTISPECIES: response regulator [Oceanimonas]|uniref:Response regulator n=1 Tax=Oceanimonas doudoroffii TaxID=84158 RepID=A0A233RI03_9GAMM|nr:MULTISPECIES: response regulator [Oceanimonas]NHI00390.1 Regulator of RpoS [Oceanimonas sp. MB9]OXY83017.1 response regulator [Oceanimonas doudoroffii]
MFTPATLVLLIDDDDVFRRQAFAWLELWGARVLEADSAAEGVMLAARLRPDLVLGNLWLATPGGLPLVTLLHQQQPSLPFVAVSGAGNMAEVAQALRAGASDYLIKPVGDWTAVKSRLAASLLPAGMREHKELRELASHLEFYRHRDMAATRLLRELGPSGEQHLGDWRLQCRHSTPWMVTQSVRLEDDLLLLVAEFDPLHQDTPMLMLLVAFLLNEPLRQYRSGASSPLHSPAQTLEYINQRLFEAGLTAGINLMLLRLKAHSNTLEAANGGMVGCDWLEQCNVGPVGRGSFSASPWQQYCRFPLELSLSGSHGGRIELTASRVPY